MMTLVLDSAGLGDRNTPTPDNVGHMLVIHILIAVFDHPRRFPKIPR